MSHTIVSRKIGPQVKQIVLPDNEWLIILEREAQSEAPAGLFQSVYDWFLQKHWVTLDQLKAINDCFIERGILEGI